MLVLSFSTHSKSVTWCFTPSQPLRLYQSESTHRHARYKYCSKFTSYLAWSVRQSGADLFVSVGVALSGSCLFGRPQRLASVMVCCRYFLLLLVCLYSIQGEFVHFEQFGVVFIFVY